MRAITFKFRFPVEAMDETTVEVRVPDGGNIAVINPQFTALLKLSNAETEDATQAVLREVAIIR